MAESNEMTVLSNAERQAKYKANKLFKSLPIDVQENILRVSDGDEQQIKNRTAAAIRYMGLFPARLASGIDGVSKRSLAKPGDADYQEHTEQDEYCSLCITTLPRLEQPREYEGMCMACVSKRAQHSQEHSQQPAEGVNA